MIEIASAIFLLALLSVPFVWLLPRGLALDGIALWTLIVLATISPFAATWLLVTSLLIPPLLRLGDRTGRRDLTAAALATLLLAGFAVARLEPGVILVGVAFCTLRHLHVVGDWWMGKLAPPGLREYLRYQFFLPAIVVGPIHRIQHFRRQAERRRWDAIDLFTGLERALVGTFSAIVIGSWIMPRARLEVERWLGGFGPFPRDWAASAMDWVALYFVFAGMTSIALGIALMLGIRLEENFNQPWRATSLLDFWRRWHMTLSSWAQDYAFRPVTALTRNPLLGLVAAMLVIGLWHEFSAYYVLWSFWQVLGIVLTRFAARILRDVAPHRLARQFLMPLGVLAWLSLSRPVVERVLEVFA